MKEVREEHNDGGPVLDSKDDNPANGRTNDSNDDITLELLASIYGILRILLF